MKKKIPLMALAVLLACLAGGCAISRKKAKTPPPPPPAAAPRTEPRSVEAALPEPRLREPAVPVPKTEPKAAPPAPVTAEVEPPKPAPERKPVRRNSRRAASKPNQEHVSADTPVPVEQQAAPPRLGEVLSAGQRKEMLAQLEGNVAAARRILAGLNGRPLSPEKNEDAGRVRAFIEQAEGMKETDLGTSVELSRRALVLAQDLVGRGR